MKIQVEFCTYWFCEFCTGASVVGLQVEKITKAFANTILDAINSMYENSSTL